MRRILSRTFVLWIPCVIAVTGAVAFAYLAAQESYRQSANDPQVQMAEDIAARLAGGDDIANVIPGEPPIDMSSSLGTWIAVYDASGALLNSSAVLDGVPPKLPRGIFDTSTWVAQKTWQAPIGVETRVTWQPRTGVRHAVTLVRFKTPDGAGYVAVGRSMRLVEERILNLTYHAAVAWALTALTTFAAIFFLLVTGWL